MEKIRIAIADDHTIVRKGLAAMLQTNKEFVVIADAPNGTELISLLSYIQPPADVCLLDVNMPVMNGYETLVALKALYPAMRFLILTQLEHEYIIIRMLKAGASGYMLKTVDPEELKRAIRTIRSQPFYNSKLVNGRLISLVQKDKEYKKLALSASQETFLKLCCTELAYKQIADRMQITERRVSFYMGLVPMDEMG